MATAYVRHCKTYTNNETATAGEVMNFWDAVLGFFTANPSRGINPNPPDVGALGKGKPLEAKLKQQYAAAQKDIHQSAQERLYEGIKKDLGTAGIYVALGALVLVGLPFVGLGGL